MTRYQAFIEKDWEAGGIAHVLVTRRREDGSCDYAEFIVDLFCLGVRDAMVETDLTESIVTQELMTRLPEDFRETIHPACAKKLIEGAVAYAESLGFSPHRDFRKARKVLSGIDASVCPRDFTYGREGRPCYIRGDSDSEERVNRVLTILEARFGGDGFDYEDPLEDEAEEAEAEARAARDELMDFLEAEPDEVPRFYYFSGALTGLLLSPHSPAPMTILEILWPDEDRVWEEGELQPFLDQIMAYWNLINGYILTAIDPNTPSETGIVDVDPEAFDDSPEGGLGLAAACMEWTNGFMHVVELFPEEWADVQKRPDLTHAWKLLQSWTNFAKPGNMDRIERAATADKPLTLNSAIVALARALRKPLPPADDPAE